MEQIAIETKSDNLILKEKSALAVKQNIVLKLNKKTSKK